MSITRLTELNAEQLKLQRLAIERAAKLLPELSVYLQEAGETIQQLGDLLHGDFGIAEVEITSTDEDMWEVMMPSSKAKLQFGGVGIELSQETIFSYTDDERDVVNMDVTYFNGLNTITTKTQFPVIRENKSQVEVEMLPW